MGHSTNVVIVEAVRTPQGAFGGTLKAFTAQQLGEAAVRELLQRARLKPSALRVSNNSLYSPFRMLTRGASSMIFEAWGRPMIWSTMVAALPRPTVLPHL